MNTPKWNEAYGNVVVESLACGVPVVAYDRGGPGELIESGKTGWVVSPDDIAAMIDGISHIDQIDRSLCRAWVEQSASYQGFSKRLEAWISRNMKPKFSSQK